MKICIRKFICVASRTALLAVSGIALVQCSKSLSPEETTAQQLISEAHQALDIADGSKAIALLDSIDTYYSVSSDIKRQSLQLRPHAILADATQHLTLLDDSLTVCNQSLDSVAALMIEVPVVGTEGYYISKAQSAKGDFMNTTGISPRVDSTGSFYLVSSVKDAGSLHHTSVTFRAGDKSATTDTIPYDGDINYRIGGSEMITFIPRKAVRIADLLSTLSPDDKLEIIFNGESGRSRKINCSAKDFLTPLSYSQIINETRRLTLERERLNQRISLAQQKIAQNETSK